MVHPYTNADLDLGEKIVRELHGVKGYDVWAEHIAKYLAAERERCARLAEGQAEFIGGDGYERLCHNIAKLIRQAPR